MPIFSKPWLIFPRKPLLGLIRKEYIMSSENRKSSILEYISYILAAIAVLIGLISVFKTNFISNSHDKALLWFAFGLVAILFPYIREITFKDLKVVIDKINTASQKLDGATISVEELKSRLNATRDELIDGYQELLHRLPEEKRNERVIKLSGLYLKEMGTNVSTIKNWLVNFGYSIKNIDETMDSEYFNALRDFQQKHGLGDDGILGYRTFNLINELRESKK